MKLYKIKAIKFPVRETFEVDEFSHYTVWEIKKKFNIWMDPFGDASSGADDGIYSDELTEPTFDSLKKCKELLVSKGLVDAKCEFEDTEEM